MKTIAIMFYCLVTPILDPLQVIRSFCSYPRYIRDWLRYARMHGSEALCFFDAQPQLHEHTMVTKVDAHYFYSNGWIMRRIVANNPANHVDIGSSSMFVNLLSAVIPVTFMDYRPLEVRIEGLTNCSGDILNLPFADSSINSLSCSHVAEHVGLGRYGDALNPYGTQQACAELMRVLVSGGYLYFALPVGKQRVCFNAHRVHDPKTIIDYFAGLELVEFSGVHDDGRFVERVALDEFSGSSYSCGMFLFKKG
ncbi:MAG: DUF268 domain-containing protein [Candidatus Omnitrophica bacterium]|nr:DUF268 domain-containing protein [Candidatus Omnitrophota bacterium]